MKSGPQAIAGQQAERAGAGGRSTVLLALHVLLQVPNVPPVNPVRARTTSSRLRCPRMAAVAQARAKSSDTRLTSVVLA
eukprot:1405959-Alexandrium_andersonii.AAC.1